MAEAKITLTNINIRQSIAILLTKLILIDLIMAFIIIGFYFILVQTEGLFLNGSSNTSLFLLTFGIAGVIKIYLSIYIVLQWLNEYYEITPGAIIHKSGIIVKKSEKYNLDKIRALQITNTFIGEIFNFATISLYDLRLNKYLDMYLIHHPDRYVSILKTLKPDLETKLDKIVFPGITKKGLEI